MQWELIKKRKEAGLTQKDMAKMLGISESSYTNKERGDYQFKQDEMFMAADYFDCRIDEIFLPSNFTVRKHDKQKA